MPLYEYQCQSCGKTLEKRQKFSDPELTECPHCNGRLERLISAPAVQFKGGGWYADLYSSKGGNKSGGNTSSGDSKPSDSNKSSGSSDSASSSSSSTTSSTPPTTTK